MTIFRFWPAAVISSLAIALTLGGCATESAPPGDSGGQTVRTIGGAAGLGLGTSDFTPGSPPAIADTGTAVGRRVIDLQGELASLQGSVGGLNGRLQQIRNDSIANVQAYNALVAAINARLQVGTTPGNPILVQQWNEAQGQLESFNAQISDMNQLATESAATSATAAFLLDSVRATFGLTGALDEDHRQLSLVEDEVSRTVVLIDRLLSEVSEDLSRQTTYLNSERANIQALQVGITNGELYGLSLANRAYYGSVPAAANVRAPDLSTIGTGGRPLVVIRFDRDDVAYEQPLYQAVSEALDRRPQAVFDLVAVSPSQGNPAERQIAANRARDRAEEVLRTLVNLGLPPNRITLTASTAGDTANSEVHLFVR